MDYPQDLTFLKPGIRDGEPAPSLHRVPVHSAEDIKQTLAPCKGLDVSAAFVNPPRFGRDATALPCDLSSTEGADAALALLLERSRTGRFEKALASKIAEMMGVSLKG